MSYAPGGWYTHCKHGPHSVRDPERGVSLQKRHPASACDHEVAVPSDVFDAMGEAFRELCEDGSILINWISNGVFISVGF